MDEEISLGDTVPSGEDMEEETIREIDKERMKRELWLAVDQLPGDQPAVLRMVYGDGMTRIKAGGSSWVRKRKGWYRRTEGIERTSEALQVQEVPGIL